MTQDMCVERQKGRLGRGHVGPGAIVRNLNLF